MIFLSDWLQNLFLLSFKLLHGISNHFIILLTKVHIPNSFFFLRLFLLLSMLRRRDGHHLIQLSISQVKIDHLHMCSHRISNIKIAISLQLPNILFQSLNCHLQLFSFLLIVLSKLLHTFGSLHTRLLLSFLSALLKLP